MKRGAITLWIAAAFAFFLLPAAARNTRKPHLAYHSASKRGGKRPAAQKQTGTVWAVVVGVNKYPEGVPSLQYPEADARLLYETLLAKGIGAKRENIFLLTAEPGQPATLAPTRANILRSLREIAAKAKPQDTIWFYFGGHGLDRGGQSYLVPADIQPADLIGSALAVSDIRNLLAKACPQGQRVLALDACHSGSPRDFALVEAAAKNAFAIDRMVTFAACDVGEQTWEFPDPPGGVFTHFMTRGLRGGADQNHDGLVSSQELYAYVSQRVKQTVFQLKNVNQTPQMLCKVGADLTLAAAGAAPSEDNLPPHLNPTHRFAPLLLISLTDVANGDGIDRRRKTGNGLQARLARRPAVFEPGRHCKVSRGGRRSGSAAESGGAGGKTRGQFFPRWFGVASVNSGNGGRRLA